MIDLARAPAKSRTLNEVDQSRDRASPPGPIEAGGVRSNTPSALFFRKGEGYFACDRRVARGYHRTRTALFYVRRESYLLSSWNDIENAIYLSPMRSATRKASERRGVPSLRYGVDGTTGTGEKATRAQVSGSCGKNHARSQPRSPNFSRLDLTGIVVAKPSVCATIRHSLRRPPWMWRPVSNTRANLCAGCPS